MTHPLRVAFIVPGADDGFRKRVLAPLAAQYKVRTVLLSSDPADVPTEPETALEFITDPLYMPTAQDTDMVFITLEAVTEDLMAKLEPNGFPVTVLCKSPTSDLQQNYARRGWSIMRPGYDHIEILQVIHQYAVQRRGPAQR
jgi:hypothetical protein